MRSNNLSFSNVVVFSELKEYLNKTKSNFLTKVGDEVNTEEFASKLIVNANFRVAKLNNEIVGIIAFYCNNFTTREAYISFLSVQESFKGRGIGSQILEMAIAHVISKGFKSISLETWENNPSIIFYKKYGFKVEENILNSKSKLTSLRMSLIIR